MFRVEQKECGMIVGISGRKQSGKSTVAEYLHRRLEGSVRLPFAFKLKEIAQECFGATPLQVWGTEAQKNTITEAGLTGRNVLQQVGAAMRGIWPGCWARAWEHEVVDIWTKRDCAVPIIVEDVRYENEVFKIRAMGGIVIRLTRSPFEDAHESETGLDGYVGFDAIIENSEMTVDDTCAEVMSICRTRGIV
jgi:hypothetical protein